jgi:hypothetical protein
MTNDEGQTTNVIIGRLPLVVIAKGAKLARSGGLADGLYAAGNHENQSGHSGLI